MKTLVVFATVRHMLSRLSRACKLLLVRIYRSLAHTRGVWVRFVICWGLALGVSLLDLPNQFDQRLSLRGAQPKLDDIVMVLINQSEWAELHHLGSGNMRPMRDFMPISDSFFWNSQTWDKLLSAVTRGHPAAILISLYFGHDIPTDSRKSSDSIFHSGQIFWGADRDNFGRPLLPVFVNPYSYNVGLLDIPSDEDHRVRRLAPFSLPLQHITFRLGEFLGAHSFNEETNLEQAKVINFRGPKGTFPTFSLRQILSSDFMPSYFEKKIVIVGVQESDSHNLQTPLGEMSRSEVYANIIDNLFAHRWIRSFPQWALLLYLFFLILFTYRALLAYPQVVSSTAILGLTVIHVGLSIWLFDQFYVWLPISSPLVAVFAAYIVFMSYQLTLKENLTWRLEQEKKNFLELETMKSNFVSLISHDLKTPIAKIQAICDRLASQAPGDSSVRGGIRAIRDESVELHRYIQSILNISRVESKALKLQRDAVDVNELIQNASRLLKPLADEKQIRFLLKLEPLFAIEADGALIQEVILNLIENAIKYSPSGSQVTVVSSEQEPWVKVAVSDQGPGIAQDELGLVFNRFYRGREQTHVTKGTGLGLYLVRYFIELHGGKVFIESAAGSGLTIGFQLPISASEGDEKL